MSARPQAVLQWSLRAGSVYFCLVAVTHMLGVKVPILYIYPTLPSYAYQDRLIAILSLGWAMVFSAAARDVERHEEIIRALLATGLGALAGLWTINVTMDLRALPASDVRAIWLGFAGFVCYLAWLIGWYWQSKARR